MRQTFVEMHACTRTASNAVSLFQLILPRGRRRVSMVKLGVVAAMLLLGVVLRAKAFQRTSPQLGR